MDTGEWMAGLDHHLLDCISHAVFVIESDDEGRPVYAAFNQFACDLLGRAEEEIVGLTAMELYPGRLGEIAFKHHVETLQSGLSRTYEILLPIKQTQRRIQTTLVPMIDDHGTVQRLIGSSTDVSGSQFIGEVQIGVDALRGELEDFVSLAAHDLRAPIRQVHGIAELLRKDFQDLGDGKLELIDILERLATKSMTLITDLLSHAQATSLTSEVIDFDFSDLVNEVMILLDPIGECSCSITPGQVVGDRTATQIILRNLIDNAIKHARPPGGSSIERVETPALHLAITLDSPQEGSFEVCVRDNGAGFPSSAIQFLDGGKLRSDSGFGLLGIRRLIHARGGTLSATNAADRSGAVVRFSLPGEVRI